MHAYTDCVGSRILSSWALYFGCKRALNFITSHVLRCTYTELLSFAGRKINCSPFYVRGNCGWLDHGCSRFKRPFCPSLKVPILSRSLKLDGKLHSLFFFFTIWRRRLDTYNSLTPDNFLACSCFFFFLIIILRRLPRCRRTLQFSLRYYYY